MSGGLAEILLLFLITQAGLNNAMYMSMTSLKAEGNFRVLGRFENFVVWSRNLLLLVSFSPLCLCVIKRSNLSEDRDEYLPFKCRGAL